MRTITFTKEYFEDIISTQEKPVIDIVRIIFNSEDKNWTVRLFTASLLLKTSCLDIDDNELQSIQVPMTLGAFITAQHRQPVLNVDRIEKFNSHPPLQKSNKKTYWKLSIRLKDLFLQEGETLVVQVIEKTHIQERIQDWKKRIDDLFIEVKDWTKERIDLSCKKGHTTSMYEELMQHFDIPPQELETLDIYKANHMILSFKPKGLWTIAANGRIDLIYKSGSYILVDFADQFQPPQWAIYTSDKKKKSIFSKTEYIKILSQLTR
jgi:hypothetical protein